MIRFAELAISFALGFGAANLFQYEHHPMFAALGSVALYYNLPRLAYFHTDWLSSWSMLMLESFALMVFVPSLLVLIPLIAADRIVGFIVVYLLLQIVVAGFARRIESNQQPDKREWENRRTDVPRTTDA